LSNTETLQPNILKAKISLQNSMTKFQKVSKFNNLRAH